MGKTQLYYDIMWITICESLSKKISETEYLLWIIPIVFQGIEENYALLKFSSELRRDVVLQQYCGLIKQEFKNLYNLDVEIKAVD